MTKLLPSTSSKCFIPTAGWLWSCSVCACCWLCRVPAGPENKNVSYLASAVTSASSLARSALGAPPLVLKSAVIPWRGCREPAVVKVIYIALRARCRLSRMIAGKYAGLKIHCGTLHTGQVCQIKHTSLVSFNQKQRVQHVTLKWYDTGARLQWLLNFYSTEPANAKALFIQPQEFSLRLRPGVSQSFPLTITMPKDQPITELTMDSSPVPAGVNITFSSITNGNPSVVQVSKIKTDISYRTLGPTFFAFIKYKTL